jgi:hypothetical protein
LNCAASKPYDAAAQEAAGDFLASEENRRSEKVAHIPDLFRGFDLVIGYYV